MDCKGEEGIAIFFFIIPKVKLVLVKIADCR